MWNFLVPAGMAALGAMRGNAKREQEEKFNRGQAEMEKYSYATGQHGQIRPVQSSAFDGALQGGMTGLQLTQAFGGFDDPSGALKTGTPKTTTMNMRGPQSSWNLLA